MNRKLLYILLLATCFGYAQNPSLDSISSHVFKKEKLEKAVIQSDTLEVNRLIDLAQDYVFRDLDSMNYYAEKAMNLADPLEFHEGQIAARAMKSLYFSEKGRREDAFKLMSEAKNIAERSKDPIIENGCYIDLGTFHHFAGDIYTSNDYFLKVVNFGEAQLEASESENENVDPKIVKYLTIAYSNLAENHKMLDHFEKALDFIHKEDALNIKFEREDHYVGQTLANKADIFLKLRRYEDARITVNESIHLLREAGDLEWEAYAERVSGDIFLDQELYHQALESYNRAKKLQDQIEDPRENAALDNAFAKVYLGRNNLKLTKQYGIKALENAEMLGQLNVAMQSAETLFKAYEAEDDLSSALYYHKLFKNYSDSLFNEKNMKSIATLEATKQIQKKEAEFEVQKLRDQNKHRFTLLVSSGGVLILLTVLFMTQRSRTLERKLNDLLTKKNKVLRRRERSLNWMNETKIKLFSIISHDLRSPIASLNNLIDLLNDRQIGPEEFIDFAPQLSDQVKNVSFTLNNLLLWSRQQMQGARNNPKKHNLHKLADLSLELLMHQAKQKDLFVRNEIPENAEIYADADQITIVFRNLISNAIKFTNKEGAIIIKAREIDESWEVQVKDTGVGMDQRTIDQMHSKSTFMESTYGTDNEKGTGIGLNLCKEMITKSGGEFRVTSAIGVGSSFFFTLEKYEEEVQEILEPSEVLE